MNTSKIISTLTHFSLEVLKLIIPFPLTIWSYLVISLANLKSAFELLLHNQFSFSSTLSPIDYHLYNNTLKTGFGELFRMARHTSGHAEQCAVCLGEVVEGEEIGELRCSHVFHQLCLRDWVRISQQNTCPLCRGSLAPRLFSTSEEDFGVEVLFFKFCSFGNSNNDDAQRDCWWLR